LFATPFVETVPRRMNCRYGAVRWIANHENSTEITKTVNPIVK